ncbi:type I-F CRISPR-associated helicase Cas3f [Erwinia sorbitola]|uniref:Type I-F CRISPR-associated helicase Cas3 n=1 Tax=Erwinia sorbitola TaxID=2681984 RepID=A0A6I6F4R1_9GAMM|nr:type I-F CRISPR-associated helicase Cas3f [Erwinia sorbitola]QGU88880.1 type I-F CRISPR-associated helicase Cas3 [Erwinia sorbitola]
MNILLISQCNKNALDESRRILDQFAERKGDRSWQTAITKQGLDTLRKLLRKTARRNTAVACHWIKNSGQTELLWIVGNLRRFNQCGVVPTHTTRRDILKSHDENSWHSVNAISLLAAIAGLFHDFGKSNRLFQQMLHKKSGAKTYQPYRHEWVSLRLFVAFVGKRADKEWIASLAQVAAADEQRVFDELVKDSLQELTISSPFAGLPPVAQVVAWLILSHHRLPAYPSWGYDNPPKLQYSEEWLCSQLDALWNAVNHHSRELKPADFQAQWQFPEGTPLRSALWRTRAQKIAQRVLTQPAWMEHINLRQRFTCHMARLSLMLADHIYSARPPTPAWQDPAYTASANTDRVSGELKQRLDEHNIGVAQNALLLARSLPQLRKTLPAITRHKGFKKRSENDKYRWQDKAWQTTCALRERAFKQGFFGVNMASTGCGKTLANARIMYALADEQQGCRFSIALGLRTLTLQTGDALRKRLGLEEDDLGVLIGSQPVAQLHKLNRHQPDEQDASGSESSEALFAGHQYVRYDGSLDDGRLSRWLKGAEGSDHSKGHDKLNKLVSAPVLVTTIDHLIGATEGVRGGKQIAPMLRLLTSDLVLDEPDDFDVNDLHALCRLVNWAGMLGSRVLLSSATLPPAMVQALFNAYRNGREIFNQACGLTAESDICCAWFDERDTSIKDLRRPLQFKQQHQAFVTQRADWLGRQPVLRRARLLPVVPENNNSQMVYTCVADTIFRSMQQLHAAHHQLHPDGIKTVSLGLVRMANINPLVAVAQLLLATPAPENTHIHYCVYHSQHPLAMRSWIEERLDAALMREERGALWQIAEVQQALEAYPQQQHHLFVVLGTAVTEVGRDHDYDWAIAEPSSMRSLIQLAGRVQRHRQESKPDDNLLILQQNIRALQSSDNQRPAYCRPGFENEHFMLASHDLSQLLKKEQYQTINAIPRITERADTDNSLPFHNLVDLEHSRLWQELQGVGRKNKSDYFAALWWREEMSWSGEPQRLKPFRKSSPQALHYLLIEEEGDRPEFYMLDSGAAGRKKSAIERGKAPQFASGVSAWVDTDYQRIYLRLAEALHMELVDVSMKFGEISLRDERNDAPEIWFFDPFLGVYGE